MPAGDRIRLTGRLVHAARALSLLPARERLAGCARGRGGDRRAPAYIVSVVTSRQAEPPADAVPVQRHPDAPAPGTVLPSHYTHCFGCGTVEHGLHIATVAGDGVDVTATFEVTRHHQGAPGIAHGGLLAAAMDEILGMLGFLAGISCVTARLETDFRRPVPVASTLHLRARADGVSGRRMYVSGEGRLGSPDGPVAVQARAVFVRVGLEHFTGHGNAAELAAAAADPAANSWLRSTRVSP